MSDIACVQSVEVCGDSRKTGCSDGRLKRLFCRSSSLDSSFSRRSSMVAVSSCLIPVSIKARAVFRSLSIILSFSIFVLSAVADSTINRVKNLSADDGTRGSSAKSRSSDSSCSENESSSGASGTTTSRSLFSADLPRGMKSVRAHQVRPDTGIPFTPVIMLKIKEPVRPYTPHTPGTPVTVRRENIQGNWFKMAEVILKVDTF